MFVKKIFKLSPLVLGSILPISFCVSCSETKQASESELTKLIEKLKALDYKPSLIKGKIELDKLSKDDIKFEMPKISDENEMIKSEQFQQLYFSVEQILYYGTDIKDAKIFVKLFPSKNSKFFELFVYSLSDLKNYSEANIIALSESQFNRKIKDAFSEKEKNNLLSTVIEELTWQWKTKNLALDKLQTNATLFSEFVTSLTKNENKKISKQIKKLLNPYSELWAGGKKINPSDLNSDEKYFDFIPTNIKIEKILDVTSNKIKLSFDYKYLDKNQKSTALSFWLEPQIINFEVFKNIKEKR